MRGRKANLVGQTFGFLRVEARDGSKGRNTAWRCRCVCGAAVRFREVNLRAPDPPSCGCMRIPFINRLAKIEQQIWRSMQRRCYVKADPAYKYYGALGVKVCARWREAFENFLSDMGPRPSPEHSIDRYPDNNGNYEPGNCRWATRQEQGRNMRNNVKLKMGGQEFLLIEYLEHHGINKELVKKRMRLGWPIIEAVLTPSRRKQKT